jgi:hypothetical protein
MMKLIMEKLNYPYFQIVQKIVQYLEMVDQ